MPLFAFKEGEMPLISTANSPCPICKYPMPAPTMEGQTVKCAYCGTINQAITSVSVPTWLVHGTIGLTLGIFFGPFILDSVRAGSEKMARRAKERLA